ncbi:hypothetical protein, partial [Pseudoclavibacter sp. CFCC 13611]|uniref:hypothetical protein n=1 Tax=Pseudoclavibacter sp. CFCC 13611 TaxID=2615178 RepID=UPI001CE41994
VGGVRHARVVGVVLGGWWGVGIVSSCHPKGAGICRVLGLKRGPLIVLLGLFGFGVWWVSVLLGCLRVGLVFPG